MSNYNKGFWENKYSESVRAYSAMVLNELGLGNDICRCDGDIEISITASAHINSTNGLPTYMDMPCVSIESEVRHTKRILRI